MSRTHAFARARKPRQPSSDQELPVSQAQRAAPQAAEPQANVVASQPTPQALTAQTLRALRGQVSNTTLQRLAAYRDEVASAEVEQALQDEHGKGHPLEPPVRREMERGFGARFEQVRVHTDAAAGDLAEALQARAFTEGQDVFFAPGEYQPGTTSGQRTLAHELAHVVQQGGGVHPQLVVGAAHDPAEQEADAAAQQVAAALRSPVATRERPTAQRQEEEEEEEVQALHRQPEEEEEEVQALRRQPEEEEEELQMQRRPAAALTTGAPAARTLRRWTSLGSWSWDHPMSASHRVTINVLVGTQAEWNSRLRNMDDEDEFQSYLQGFLESIHDPESVTRTSHRMGFRNYVNTVTRAPSEAEIMAFMRALYALGRDLDLPNATLEMSGISRTYLQQMLSAVIQRYQSKVITEASNRGEVIGAEGVRGVAQQGGSQVRMAMIANAGATAMKSIDLVAAANQLPQASEGERGAREVARRNAFETVRNSGRTMRYVLEEHAAALTSDRAWLEGVFDTVWSAVPGGGALVSVAKSLLKRGFTEMIRSATTSSAPTEQAEAINDQFVQYVNQLVPDHITAADASAAINGFEAVRR
jgi:hypothetical protein